MEQGDELVTCCRLRFGAIVSVVMRVKDVVDEANNVKVDKTERCSTKWSKARLRSDSEEFPALAQARPRRGMTRQPKPVSLPLITGGQTIPTRHHVLRHVSGHDRHIGNVTLLEIHRRGRDATLQPQTNTHTHTHTISYILWIHNLCLSGGGHHNIFIILPDLHHSFGSKNQPQ